MHLITGEQAIEGHGGKALRHVSDVGVVNTWFLPLELLRNVSKGHAWSHVPLQTSKIAGRELLENLPVARGRIPPALLEKLLHLDQRLLTENTLLHVFGHRRHILGAEEHAGIDTGCRNPRSQKRGIEAVRIVRGCRSGRPLRLRAVQEVHVFLGDLHVLRPDTLTLESGNNRRCDRGIGKAVRRIKESHHAIQQ